MGQPVPVPEDPLLVRPVDSSASSRGTADTTAAALSTDSIPLTSSVPAFKPGPEQPVCDGTSANDPPAESAHRQSETFVPVNPLTSPGCNPTAGVAIDHVVPPPGASPIITGLATHPAGTAPALPERKTGAETRPWWTLPQLRYLLDVVLRTAEVTRSHALKVVEWIQTRNEHAAACHSRRRERARAEQNLLRQ